MDFNLFMYCTIGRPDELKAGMAGKPSDLYQRMVQEIAEYAQFAEQAGYAGFGHPEHHLQIEGFEVVNEPTLMSMWLGSRTKRLRVITCGFVSTTHNPLRTAESIGNCIRRHARSYAGRSLRRHGRRQGLFGWLRLQPRRQDAR